MCPCDVFVDGPRSSDGDGFDAFGGGATLPWRSPGPWFGAFGEPTHFFRPATMRRPPKRSNPSPMRPGPWGCHWLHPSRSKRVTDALLKMVKLDIVALEKAYRS